MWGEERESPTHLRLTRSFAKSLGGAPGPQNCLLPQARLRGAGRPPTGLLPPDMGRPLLLSLLLLLFQTCIPGRDWMPEPLSGELGLELRGEGGGGRWAQSSTGWRARAQSPAPPPHTHTHSQIIILLLSAAPHGTVPGPQ